jgi:hypothetical protein
LREAVELLSKHNEAESQKVIQLGASR